MKYVFFGTPRFAEIVLQGLLDAGMPPVALVCNPDRPVGRKKNITAPATKVLAENYTARGTRGAIEILQPEKIDDDFLDHLRVLAPDFAVVAAYAKILPRTLLDIPRLGTLGVHPSLLPRYRGASPIQSAILAGGDATAADVIPQTGTTIYLMDEKTDHGPVLGMQKIALDPNANYLQLEEMLAKAGVELLKKIIPDFVAGKIMPLAQDESLATYTKKFTAQDAFIAPENLAATTAILAGAAGGNKTLAQAILRKINAFNPEPGAWTMLEGKRVKLLRAKLDGDQLVILETQKEGERRATDRRATNLR